jgi:hypothetical protein
MMEVLIQDEGTIHQTITVKDICGDMGESERMQLIQQSDGDICLTFYDSGKHYIGSLEFCTMHGGGRYPVIAEKFRELIQELIKER